MQRKQSIKKERIFVSKKYTPSVVSAFIIKKLVATTTTTTKRRRMMTTMDDDHAKPIVDASTRSSLSVPQPVAGDGEMKTTGKKEKKTAKKQKKEKK